MYKFSLKYLQKCSYTRLQHIAKDLDLQWQFKKAHLVKLINTKKLKTEKDLINLQRLIRIERRRTNNHASMIEKNSKVQAGSSRQKRPIIKLPTSTKYTKKESSRKSPKLTGRNSSTQDNAILGEPVSKEALTVNNDNQRDSAHNKEVLTVKLLETLEANTPISGKPKATNNQVILEAVRKPNEKTPQKLANVEDTRSDIRMGIKVTEIPDKLIQAPWPANIYTFIPNQDRESFLRRTSAEVLENDKNTPGQENSERKADQMPLAEQSDEQGKEMEASTSHGFLFEGINQASTSESNDNQKDLNACGPMADALELLTHDVEYMQCTGSDFKVGCYLCAWSGHNFLLENHLRKEHYYSIKKHSSNEWITTFSLNSLLNRESFMCKTIEYDGTLYILSAMYKYPDTCLIAINTLPSCNDITKIAILRVYNRVTAESYSWEGLVGNLPHTMPYYQASPSLKLELSKMNILPDGVRIEFTNKKFVLVSTTEADVVDVDDDGDNVGRLPINNIEIQVYVKLCDTVLLD